MMKMAKIIRKFQDDSPDQVLLEGVTVEEAKAHCSDPATSGEGWFDVWYREPEDE